ncbi:MAG: hypothetical protein ABSH13_24120 [Candidatus Acidiferrum sp.]|jgi:hypothetical protein
MFTPEPASYRDPLDLLRRFAPTPLKAQVYLEIANVLLETNDLSFLSSLSQLAAREPASQSCRWKIVRDVDVRGTTSEASIVMAGSLIVYCMGPACLIGADRERGEILAFIGRDVDVRRFEESILPSLIRLTEFVTRKQDAPILAQNTTLRVGGACNA